MTDSVTDNVMDSVKDNVKDKAMDKRSALVFVYGNARRSEGNRKLLKGAERVAEQCWTAGKLHDTGEGYPVLCPGGGGFVYGELFRVPMETLRLLDAWEGIRDGACETGPRSQRSLRALQPVFTDRGEELAYVYLYPGAKRGELPSIEHGDWAFCRRERERETLLYFAYASCMDDERFRRAKVDHLFRDCLGRGVLRGYDLRFSRRAKDGGRADLAELGGGGWAEGKVYRIGTEALEYLKKREGVHAGHYRPAFVEIGVGPGGRMKRQALTFLVVRKSDVESPPPPGYLLEIRRGGSTVWTAEYALSFERKLLALQTEAAAATDTLK
ncbi:gamma-glutamylcyclotransferase family protein [Cohnella fermenti]|uniref:Gamma-glutamylcyclotransferase n=1 Tax=Cohnella fermenti TaxID=2565925 RepID=A0A4S4BIA2_9BACL|nr:gamma-glutamylcyclotransferase family protein [Cohnella fermenti]THF73694.1 gamma-glutamylcyclotransferase [Cohnella fermenti]